MIETTHGAYWAALGISAGTSLAFAVSTAFALKRAAAVGTLLALLALVALTLSLGVRWVATGHGPYLGRYEAVGSYAWALLALFTVLQWRFSWARAAGLVVGPAAFLLLGAGVLSPMAPQFESPAMRSAWLWIHVTMAKIALASLVLSAALAAVYLLQRRATLQSGLVGAGPGTARVAQLPQTEEISVRLASLGFLLLAVVIGAGALWANTAWGSYWSWDPIETWALATWVLYGIALHLHRLWRVSGVRWALISIGTLLTSAFLFLVMWGLTLSPHWVYLA